MKRPFLVPEVIQSSAMDCGPAVLKALLDGVGKRVSYGRLREACQTDVDGTSIDTLEDLANELGVRAEQVIVPTDHLRLDSRNLPCIIVVVLPTGAAHFVVVWRMLGGWLQVMDPAVGRRWIRAADFLAREVYVHRMIVPAADWFHWASSDEFQLLLMKSARRLEVEEEVTELLDSAIRSKQWQPLATLDAAVRYLARMNEAKVTKNADECRRLLRALVDAGGENPALIPPRDWSAMPAPDDQPGMAIVRGVVLLRMKGETAADPTSADSDRRAARDDPGVTPIREALRVIFPQWRRFMLVLFGSLALAGAVLVESLLLRSLLDLRELLGPRSQRVAALIYFALFGTTILIVERQATGRLLHFGRQLEVRLRSRFYAKVARLRDQYFQSRLVSDMAERVHAIHELRFLPLLYGKLTRSLAALTFMAAAIAWVQPAATLPAILAVVCAIGFPLLYRPISDERNSRVKTHRGALMRFYLDALTGLVPIRAHNGEKSVRIEHEALLVRWSQSHQALLGSLLTVEAAQLLSGIGLAVWLVYIQLAGGAHAATTLLLVYWAMTIPMLGDETLEYIQKHSEYRSLAVRLLEPLGAPEEPPSTPAVEMPSPGVAIQIRDASLMISGHPILHDINLSVACGEHLAIVGESGAGKSSLVGLLLGWYAAVGGTIEIDGEPIDHGRLRETTVWIDPAVQLWNRSLLFNLLYGSDRAPSLAGIIESAQLAPVLQRHGDLQEAIGESGRKLSGGEGERVRIGRGLARGEPRLVILDEAFRGLNRELRETLLHDIRDRWRSATILLVTHEIEQTMNFDRVAVMRNGTISEIVDPRVAREQPASDYRKLLDARRSLTEHYARLFPEVYRVDSGTIVRGDS